MSIAEIQQRLEARAMNQRERNRREMPQTAAILDSFKAAGIWPPQAFKFTENDRTVSYNAEKLSRDRSV